MIVIDFDDIVVKLFVTLRTRNRFQDFLLLKVKKKIFTYTEIRGRKFYFAPLMKVSACFMSSFGLFYAIYIDQNLSQYYDLIPAVKLGFDIIA